MSDTGLARYRTFILADTGDKLELIESAKYLSETDPLPDFEPTIDWDGDIYGGLVIMVGVFINGEWVVSATGLEPAS